MRAFTLLIAATLVATPAVAQDTTTAETPSGFAGPDANMATNATEAATVNGLANDPAMQAAPPVPVLNEAEGLTDATVLSEESSGGGFPWGLLGILGLIGLIGRFRS